MITGAVAQDGARAFHLIPENTHILSVTGTFVRTEIAGSTFDAGVLTPTYRGTFDFMGNAAAFLVGIPIGNVSAELAPALGGLSLENDVAQGDLFIGGLVGLVGSPSLSPMEYAQYKPGFRAGLAGRLYMPTGDYDSGRLINLGQNRWSLQMQLPLSYVLGDTMIDPNLTTFELVPTVQIYGDNEDPFPPADVLSKDPLWSVEGHITHNFGRSLWASVDATYLNGGETSVNGVPRGDGAEAVLLGATVGMTLNSSFAVRLSYDKQVYSSRPDTDVQSVRATAAYLF